MKQENLLKYLIRPETLHNIQTSGVARLGHTGAHGAHGL